LTFTTSNAARSAALLVALTTVACAAPQPPVRRAPEPKPDTVVVRDTLPARAPAVIRDTIAARDSAARRDSIARRDSLARRDSTARRDAAVRPDSAPRRPRTRGAKRKSTAGTVRVCGGGDVTLGNNLDPAWATRAEGLLRRNWGVSAHPDSLIAPLRPLVNDADIVLLNVESAIGTGPASRKCGSSSTNCYAFRSPVTAADALRSVAPDAAVVGNIANNHARDAGPAGFHATRQHLEAAGVHVTGMDTLATPVAAANGDTVAFLGFYTSTETPDARDLAAVRRHVARARARWPMVVVTAHIGAEGHGAQRTRNATEMFLQRIDRGNPVAFARTAFDAGATLVIGHGPHVMRAAEWREGKLAFYSLGNLLTYGPFGNREPSNRGAIACASITRDGVVAGASIRSTVQRAPGIVAPDASGRAAALVDSLARLDFPRTGARVRRDGTIVIPHDVPDVTAPAERTDTIEPRRRDP
jgi:hypothetical protein